MPRATDWAAIADQLGREREKVQDRLPDGVTCWLCIECHGYGTPEFTMTIHHRTEKVSGNGRGRTPAKAVAAAVKDFQEQMRRATRKPRLAEAEVKALPPAPLALPARSLFE